MQVGKDIFIKKNLHGKYLFLSEGPARRVPHFWRNVCIVEAKNILKEHLLIGEILNRLGKNLPWFEKMVRGIVFETRHEMLVYCTILKTGKKADWVNVQNNGC